MTRLVITNAIYFKGKWADQFDKNNTKEKDFKVSPGTVVRAHMMKLTDKEAKFNYAETDNLQVLEIPYEGNELSMLILLPKDNNLEAAQRAVDPEKLAELKNSLKKQRVDIYIPKFKFQAKYFMAEDLKEMGMPIAFSLLEADFSGMTGKNDLYIGEVIHQAFVDVNEEGTEASAATAAIMYAKSIVFPGTPRIFNADHPFIFIIQERASGNILFIGRVSDPTRA
jgi:serpin B